MKIHIKVTLIVYLKGVIEDILVKIVPGKYSSKDVNGEVKEDIYAVLLKALYDTLVEIFLFWKDQKNKLDVWRFETNSFDTCVINNTLDGKQYTLIWDVDDI